MVLKQGVIPMLEPTSCGRSCEDRELQWLRASVVLVWLWTALVSFWELHGQSRALLASGGIDDDRVATVVTISGAVLDCLLCIWIVCRPSQYAYLTALAVMLVMTLLATWMIPSLWLHPLGPLSKNVPIAVVLVLLARRSP